MILDVNPIRDSHSQFELALRGKNGFRSFTLCAPRRTFEAFCTSASPETTVSIVNRLSSPFFLRLPPFSRSIRETHGPRGNQIAGNTIDNSCLGEKVEVRW